MNTIDLDPSYLKAACLIARPKPPVEHIGVWFRFEYPDGRVFEPIFELKKGACSACVVDLKDFESGNNSACKREKSPFNKYDLWENALRSLSSNECYRLLWKNCEHYAREVFQGKKESKQVQNVLFGLGGLLLAGLAVWGISKAIEKDGYHY